MRIGTLYQCLSLSFPNLPSRCFTLIIRLIYFNTPLRITWVDHLRGYRPGYHPSGPPEGRILSLSLSLAKGHSAPALLQDQLHIKFLCD